MNRAPTDFSDLDESDAELNAHVSGIDVTQNKTFLEYSAATGLPKEPCRACSGSGKFYGYSGRVVGECYRCKGTGKVSIRAQKGVETRKRNAQEKALTKERERTAWREQHADVWQWCYEHQDHNNFALAMWVKLGEYGSLTENMVNAVRKILTQYQERAAARAAALVQAEPQGSGLDLSKLPAGCYAVPLGDTRLKLLIQKPSPPSKWAGWVFVADAAEYGHRQKYGKQPPGKTYTGRLIPELTQILQDPKAAAIAYGRLTGTCAVCGRHLEDAESVKRGIGPICAGKFS